MGGIKKRTGALADLDRELVEGREKLQRNGDRGIREKGGHDESSRRERKTFTVRP